MKALLEVELKPFGVPNFALLATSLSDAEDRSIPLSMLGSTALDELCKQFRDEVFKKAGKAQPPQQARHCVSCNRLLD